MISAKTGVFLKRFILFLFISGVTVTAAELLLLEHTEDYWQLLPLVLLFGSLGGIFVFLFRPSAATILIFQFLMVLFIICGLVGHYLHYQVNVEFELEMYPSLDGLNLLWEAISGATPALAPATMTYLGLVGLLYAFLHRLSNSSPK